MPKLILCRHGQTDFNAERRYQGQSDIPLNAAGEAQAEALQRRVASFKLDAAYTSDLARARRTAQIVLNGHTSGLSAVSTPLLREVNGGGFEGLTWEEMNARYPVETPRWNADRVHIAPPDGGESVQMAYTRIAQALEEIVAALPDDDQNVLAVVHGGVIGILLSHLMGMDLGRLWQWRSDNCSLTIVDIYKEGGILSLFNDTTHLEGLPVTE